MDQENVPPITFGFDFDDFDPSLMNRYFEFVENSEFLEKFEEIFIPIGKASKRKYLFIISYSFQQNLFYGVWSLQRPAASVRVKKPLK